MKQLKEELKKAGLSKDQIIAVQKACIDYHNRASSEPKHKHNFKGVFEAFYERLKGESYYWTAKDAMHAKQLATKIKFKIKEKNLEDSEEFLNYSFEVLLNRITDKWLIDNLTLPNINSQFNKIIANGKPTNHNDWRERAISGAQSD